MSVFNRLRRRWRSVSFRSGLLAALSVGVVTLMAFFVSVVLVFTLFVITDAVAETALVDRAEDQLLLGVEPADLRLESTWDGPDRGTNDSESFWMVLSEDGEVLNSEGELRLDLIDAEFDGDIAIELGVPARSGDAIGIKTVENQDWFYLERSVAVDDGPTYRVIVASGGTFSLWQFARSSFPVTIPILLVLMAVAFAVTSWLTRRALRRVEHMRVEVEMITQQSLDRRVPVVNASDGIEKLAHTMNDMLERLESSSAQQTQFLADASHELRSPVAGLLAQLEVATTYPDKVDAAALLPKLRGQAQRLQLLVDDLLFLSRSEADTTPSSGFAAVAIDDLIEAEVAHQRDIAAGSTDSAVNIVVGDPSGAMVDGNRRELERAVRNLVDNAVRHAEHEVRIDGASNADVVAISVADDGPGIPADDGERIFQRFVRLDEARTRDDGGSGLGLAIASEIASRHGGSIALVTAAPDGAAFELTLPSQAG